MPDMPRIWIAAHPVTVHHPNHDRSARTASSEIAVHDVIVPYCCPVEFLTVAVDILWTCLIVRRSRIDVTLPMSFRFVLVVWRDNAKIESLPMWRHLPERHREYFCLERLSPLPIFAAAVVHWSNGAESDSAQNRSIAHHHRCHTLWIYATMPSCTSPSTTEQIEMSTIQCIFREVILKLLSHISSTYVSIFVGEQRRRWMKNGFLCIAEHFGYVVQCFRWTFNAAFHFRKFLHDTQYTLQHRKWSIYVEFCKWVTHTAQYQCYLPQSMNNRPDRFCCPPTQWAYADRLVHSPNPEWMATNNLWCDPMTIHLPMNRQYRQHVLYWSPPVTHRRSVQLLLINVRKGKLIENWILLGDGTK